MPRVAKVMQPIEVKRLTKKGFNAVGTVAGLGLYISTSYTKSWVFRVTIGGSRKSLGLGSYPTVSLKEASERAKVIKQEIDNGIDPLAKKRALKLELANQIAKNKSFKACVQEYLSKQVFGNQKHKKQWSATLETYAYPTIGNLNIDDIELFHIKEILNPIWYTKNATADRLLGRIRTVIDYATVCGHRNKLNPATWKGFLERIYPSPNKVHEVVHMRSVPYSEIYIFLQNLGKYKTVTSRCLQLLIHTAVRSHSIRLAKWSEIDMTQKIWTIPKENTKSKKKDHRVPLSEQAIQILQEIPPISGTDLIFPSYQQKVLSDSALNKLMREMISSNENPEKAVPHGFRATFRTWVLEKTNHSYELAEMSLMHTVGDAVYQAYQRGDGIEKRRRIMQDWSDFISKPYSQSSAEVVEFRRIAA
jgi:integrase